MRKQCHRLVAISLAFLVIAGGATANASILTIIDPNCTGFTLGGVAPNQTLSCVGGSGVVANPKTITIDNQHCNNFTLGGVAPNQVLICSASSVPVLVSAGSRKVHATMGKIDLPVALPISSP